MADIANQTLELLRRFRDETAARFNKVDLSLRDLTEQARINNAHVAALVQHENFATTKFAELEARVDRIEKRLELRDPQLPEER
jgi:predicted transcriptional regulator